jgi:hypothetical protein
MIAVLFSYQPSTEETLSQVIDWGDDPVTAAWNFKRSIENDFPDAIWSVGADQEARKAHGQATMKSLLGPDWEPTT